MWLIAFFVVCLIATFGGMPAALVAWVRPISIIGIVVVVIVECVNYNRSQKEYEEKYAPEIQRRKERPPVSELRYHENINSPQRRDELIKWNREHPDRLLDGPYDEAPVLRSLRLSLLTPEQLATIPFRQRICIRNKSRHGGPSTPDIGGSCPICGGSMSHRDPCCSECTERYRTDLANGWEKTIPSDIRGAKPADRSRLWILQQCVAIDLSDGVITELTARTEMKEVIEVARQEIAKIAKQESEKKASVQQRRNQQFELSDIVKRLS